jgi:hypothetical protein
MRKNGGCVSRKMLSFRRTSSPPRGHRVATSAHPVVIKRYANTRLYNTATARYVSLDFLVAMAKTREDFVVHDAKSGEDITRSMLVRIIAGLGPIHRA